MRKELYLNNKMIKPKKLMYVFLLISIFFFSGCSLDFDANIKEPLPMSLENSNTTLTIENLFERCTHNAYGDNCYVVRKFGESANIGTSVSPVTNGNVYQTPMYLTSLEISSDNSNDNILGTGARTVAITGLSANWSQITEIVALNGTTPVLLQNQFYRVYRMYVLGSGTYASATANSHAGDIELRGVVGGELWATITINGIALGQSEIGVYTVPVGYHAHLGTIFVHNNGVKTSNIFMFVRQNASDVIAPYPARRIQFQVHGVSGSEVLLPKSISGGIPATSDIGFMANTDVGTTEVSVDFEILLIKEDSY